MSSPDWSHQQKKIYRIEQWGNLDWSDFSISFQGFYNLDVTATDIPIMENVTSFFGMFMSCANLTYNSSINYWNVSNVEDMSGMFFGRFLFNQPLNDLENFKFVKH